MSSCPLLLTIFSLEESYFHVFHQLLHDVHSSNTPNSGPLIPRVYEFFTYAHQQITRRAAVERELAGLPELVPLDPVNMRQSLGPGYRLGWYSFGNLAGRKDNCKMEEHPDSRRDMENFDSYHRTAMQRMEQIDGKNLEEFANVMCGNVHNAGPHQQKSFIL